MTGPQRDWSRTAIVTQECQEGVVGPSAPFRELAAAARAEALPNISRLLAAGRAAGLTIVHCLAWRRHDDRGSNVNCRLFAATRNMGVDMTPTSPAAQLVPEVGLAPGDLVLGRYHGVGPMGGTDLNPVLRNLGVDTVVGVGVSVNLGITSLTLDAVNAGYQVVLPRDAVAGVPATHVESMFDHVFPLIATVTTTSELVRSWTRH